MRDYSVSIRKRIEFVISIFEKIGAKHVELKSGLCWTLDGLYFRPDCIPFTEKPFIVIEVTGSLEDAENNIFEDADPFPLDLDDINTEKEVLFSIFH